MWSLWLVWFKFSSKLVPSREGHEQYLIFLRKAFFNERKSNFRGSVCSNQDQFQNYHCASTTESSKSWVSETRVALRSRALCSATSCETSSWISRTWLAKTRRKGCSSDWVTFLLTKLRLTCSRFSKILARRKKDFKQWKSKNDQFERRKKHAAIFEGNCLV